MVSPLVVMETQSACHQIQSVLKIRKEPSTFSLHTLRPMLFCCQAGSQATNVLTCSSYHRVPLSTKCGFNTAHPSSLSTIYQQIAYSTFCTLWRRILPHIIITKPMSDLCWTCQSNNMKILQSANHPEESKSEVMILMYITPLN